MLQIMTRTIHYCTFCDYKSDRKHDRDRHVTRKHGIYKEGAPTSTTHPTIDYSSAAGSGSVPVEQTNPSHSQDEKHSNLQEEGLDQLYENNDQWQKAYEQLKLQFQQVEKVTTCNDGRPSHVSIQLFDKCCKGLIEYRDHCQGLLNLCQRVNTEKEQQLDRFCTAWEDLKWERDTFANEINRRDCCGEGVIDKKCARKLRKQMLRNLNN